MASATVLNGGILSEQPGGIGVGTVALLLYTRHALRATHPLLDFRLLRIATYRTGVAGGDA